MKQPHECSDMTEIRQEIDRIDHHIIQQLAERCAYVQAAAKFKTDATAVKAPERFKAMLQTRREWAATEGLDPDVIEKMYTDLVNYFISEEMRHWKKQ